MSSIFLKKIKIFFKKLSSGFLRHADRVLQFVRGRGDSIMVRERNSI